MDLLNNFEILSKNVFSNYMGLIFEVKLKKSEMNLGENYAKAKNKFHLFR